MLEELIKYDKEVFLFLNNLGSETWDAFWLAATNKFVSIPLYLLLLVLIFKKYHWKTVIIIIFFIVVMIAATDQLANVFKYGFERLRPCHDEEVLHLMRLVKSYCGGKYGYFSAHAANSFALATFFILLLKKHFRWLAFLLLVWAIVVSYSRIYIGVHFPLDAITGVSFGMLIGWLFFSILNFFFKDKFV